MHSPVLSPLEALVAQLDLAVDGAELAAAFRLREKLLATAMVPLHRFDADGLYQLSHARSTATFLEREAGLAPGDAGVAVAERDEQPGLHGAHQRQLAGVEPCGHVQVDVLEMHVGDAVAVALDERARLVAAEREVAGVQAPAHVDERREPGDAPGAPPRRCSCPATA